MDTAVALVQAYLQVNGYLTVTEYPLVEIRTRGQVRSRTDLDIIAFRFAAAQPRRRALGGGTTATVDPALHAPAGAPDMLIGEVKEGPARFNPALRDPAVLEAAIVRFACCSAEAAQKVIGELLKDGTALTPHGHHVRLIAFGMGGPHALSGQHVIRMEHVVHFLRRHVHENRRILRAATMHDPVLSLLNLLDKAGLDNTTDSAGLVREV